MAQRESLNLAESVAQAAADTMEASDGIVQEVVERVASDGTNGEAGRRLRQIVMRAVGATPRLHDVVVVNERGRSVLQSPSSSGQPDLDYRDREAYRYHRAHAGTQAFISVPAPSNSVDRWDVEVSRRVSGSNGRFAGIVVAQIALNFEQNYAGVDIGASGVMKLVRDDGTIVVQRPTIDLSTPLSIADSAMFHRPLADKIAGTVRETLALDGVRRMYAFRRLDRHPLVAVVGLAEDEYLANWVGYAWTNALTAIIVVTLIAILGVVITIMIDQRNRAEGELTRLAMLDGLTGIANRRQLDDVLAREWHSARGNGSSLALLMIDADHFKNYNDLYGHQAGDDILRTLGTAIVEHVRPGDLAARYGGEEFAVVLPITDLGGALVVAERIRTVIADLRLSHVGNDHGIVTVSIGVACLNEGVDGDPGELIADADRALYVAKRLGRNCCAPAPSADSAANLATASIIDGASVIENGSARLTTTT